jgi:hypothetical protein
MADIRCRFDRASVCVDQVLVRVMPFDLVTSLMKIYLGQWEIRNKKHVVQQHTFPLSSRHLHAGLSGEGRRYNINITPRYDRAV